MTIVSSQAPGGAGTARGHVAVGGGPKPRILSAEESGARVFLRAPEARALVSPTPVLF